MGSVGFYKARSHQVIPVDWCRIQKPQADAAAEALRRYLRVYGVTCYDEKTRRGLVRHLYVRTNGAGQSLLCVLVNGKKLPHERDSWWTCCGRRREAVGVVLGVNTRPTGAVLGQEYRTLWGADVLTDTLCGLTFRLSVPSFYQVNREMAEVLYRRAVEFAGLTGHGDGAGPVLRRGHHHPGDGTPGGRRGSSARRSCRRPYPMPRENAQRNGGWRMWKFFCGDGGGGGGGSRRRGCGRMSSAWTLPARGSARRWSPQRHRWR